jgi:hypothetical protein
VSELRTTGDRAERVHVRMFDDETRIMFLLKAAAREEERGARRVATALWTMARDLGPLEMAWRQAPGSA